MKRMAQAVILVLVLTMVGGVGAAVSVQGKVEIVFTPQERQMIREYYSKEIIEQAGGVKGKGKKGLPPGLAKKEKLPPGIRKQLQRNGTLPPGLEKKMEPLPKEVEVRMKQLPPEYTRVVIGTDVIILDKTTQKILDIIHDVAILARDIAK